MHVLYSISRTMIYYGTQIYNEIIKDRKQNQNTCSYIGFKQSDSCSKCSVLLSVVVGFYSSTLDRKSHQLVPLGWIVWWYYNYAELVMPKADLMDHQGLGKDRCEQQQLLYLSPTEYCANRYCPFQLSYAGIAELEWTISISTTLSGWEVHKLLLFVVLRSAFGIPNTDIQWDHQKQETEAEHMFVGFKWFDSQLSIAVVPVDETFRLKLKYNHQQQRDTPYGKLELRVKSLEANKRVLLLFPVFDNLTVYLCDIVDHVLEVLSQTCIYVVILCLYRGEKEILHLNNPWVKNLLYQVFSCCCTTPATRHNHWAWQLHAWWSQASRR